MRVPVFVRVVKSDSTSAGGMQSRLSSEHLKEDIGKRLKENLETKEMSENQKNNLIRAFFDHPPPGRRCRYAFCSLSITFQMETL